MSQRDLNERIAHFKKLGWRKDYTNGGHIRLTHDRVPGAIISASTPSDHRGLMNFDALVRRKMRGAGLLDKPAETNSNMQPRTKPKLKARFAEPVFRMPFRSADPHGGARLFDREPRARIPTCQRLTAREQWLCWRGVCRRLRATGSDWDVIRGVIRQRFETEAEFRQGTIDAWKRETPEWIAMYQRRIMRQARQRIAAERQAMIEAAADEAWAMLARERMIEAAADEAWAIAATTAHR